MADDGFVIQEWYCTVTGGGCGGYFAFPLNSNFSGTVTIICPKCEHEHQRIVKNGEIKEDGRFDHRPTQNIRPSLVTYSKEPRSKKFSRKRNNERDGAVLSRDEQLAQSFINDRWFELHGDKV